jgi:2,3-dihydroxyphenylpropionate 1,2-dioxygenase
MTIGVVCASHTPLMRDGLASPETRDKVAAGFERLAAWVEAFRPDCIIQFAPDHFNGFFYDLMPPFCVGVGAVSLGDWGGGTGPLPVPEDFALRVLHAAREADFDPAVSYRMPVDHGFVQMWEAMFGNFQRFPIVPVFVNCAAPPLPTYRRARRLGEAIGSFALASGQRILFAASGGLSHDPPLPTIAGAPPELRERLTDGRNPTAEARRQREARVLEAGRLAAAGEGPCLPLNEDWDRDFLGRLRQGDLAALDALTADGVRTVAGRGGNEVLCWIAAFAALSAAGSYDVGNLFYEAIPGWIAGMAMVTGETRRETTR